jgi:hypothetical protein
VAVAGVAAWLDGRDAGPTTTNKDSVSTATLPPTRTVEAGAVTVKLAPRQFDATGATFKIIFDTHSVALDLDVARQSRLVVGDSTWPVDGWSGDGPGGHHREGELRFRPIGPAAGTATLTLAGLPEPVTATWELGG